MDQNRYVCTHIYALFEIIGFSPEKVDCISTILRTNTVSLATPTRSSMSPKMPTTPLTTPSHPSAAVESSKTRHPSVPFKGLVSGTTVRLTLVSSHSPTGEEAENFVDSASESSESVFPTLHGLDSSVVPLAQLQLFNIICGVTTTTSGGYLLEGSCFNMSVGYSGSDDIVCSKFSGKFGGRKFLCLGRFSQSNNCVNPSHLCFFNFQILVNCIFSQ